VKVSERRIIFLVGAVQFINILDFMMILPLGPDFALALGIPNSQLGYVGGAYTAAASVAGFAGSFFLDRFDRRRALTVAMLGLALGTFAGALATGLASLMAARLIAGAFGGPATSLSMSIVADVVPPERRGKAMGAVMGAFAVASVLGVPAGLILAQHGGWRLPFIVVAALGVVITAGAATFLPPLRLHLASRPRQMPSLASILSRPVVRASYATTAVVMMAGFIVIPNFSAYLQYNLGFPRDQLQWLYLAGGAFAFFGLRVFGRLVDRFGAFVVGTVAVALVLVETYLWFVAPVPWIPVMVLFVAYMLTNSLRNVAYRTLTSRVPGPAERARFMSIDSSIQHLASALGAFFSAQLLTERPDHSLGGVPTVALISMALTALLPLLLRSVETQLAARS
jgi:predicted MFS family arabinose efflux permease